MVVPDYSGYNEAVGFRQWTQHVPFQQLFQRPASMDETRELSEELFRNIVSERVVHSVSESTTTQIEGDETDSSISELFHPITYSRVECYRVGCELRRLADAFENSEERREVREMAEKVDYKNLSQKENFLEFLSALFPDVRNVKSRIVILFVFCSDLIIRVLRNHLFKYVRNFFNWATSFFRETVSTWVQEHGGWGALVSAHFPRVAMTVCFLAVTAAAFIYIRKHWN